MRIILLLALITACASGCKTGPRPVADVANDLRHKVSPFWTVTTSNSTICLTSKDEVYLLSMLNPPAIPGESTNTGGGPSDEELFNQYGRKTYYVVTLSFVPRLTSADLEKIHAERLPYERNRPTLQNWGEIQGGLDKFPLPTLTRKIIAFL